MNHATDPSAAVLFAGAVLAVLGLVGGALLLWVRYGMAVALSAPAWLCSGG